MTGKVGKGTVIAQKAWEDGIVPLSRRRTPHKSMHLMVLSAQGSEVASCLTEAGYEVFVVVHSDLTTQDHRRPHLKQNIRNLGMSEMSLSR